MPAMLEGCSPVGALTVQVAVRLARSISMVYQNPGAALNPSMRVGAQVAEAFTVYPSLTGSITDAARAMHKVHY